MTETESAAVEAEFQMTPFDLSALNLARDGWNRRNPGGPDFDTLPRDRRFAIWQVAKWDLVGDAPADPLTPSTDRGE